MRVKTLILCSASFGILGLAASPALAQTPPSNAGSPAAPAAGSPAATDSVAAAAEDPAETIVVTGLRRSLQSAQNIKRNSDQFIDSVVAEDIGKLPDVALSDTAARIPGVQVDRGGGEASRVLIRGLPNFITTYNGREIFTAETRLVALQDFPAAGIAAIEVYKTTTANLVEGGLAGEVNVRSRRPFDFTGLEIAGSVWGQHEKESGKNDPNGNLLISDRWETGIGEFGALINFSYTRLTYLDSTRSNTDFIAQNNIGPGGSAVRFPDIQRIDYGTAQRSRPSINGALQWRPMPGLEFYAEGLWQGFRNKISDRELTVPLWGGQQYTNVVLQPGTNLLQSVTVTNPFRPDGFQGGTFNKTNTYQFAVGGSYHSGPLQLSADLARTRSQFTGNTESVDYAFSHPVTVNANTNVPQGDGGSEFQLPGFDASNPANYKYRGFFEERQIAKGDDWQARVDADYSTGWSFIDKIDAGLRYVDRYAHRQYGNHYWGGDVVLNQNVPITAVPLDYELFHAGFRGSDIQQFRDWLAPTYDSIQANIDRLRAFSRLLGDPANLGPPAPFPDQTFSAMEKSYAGYAQIHYAFGTGIRVDGDIGLRAIKTKTNIVGTSFVGGVATPLDLTKEYTDWLPNASARIRFTNELQLRLSATKTRTRPDFGQLNPGGSVDAPPGCVQNETNCIRNLNGGNPNLDPIKSNNYDVSLEYYFSHAGAASFAVFRRDITGFIETESNFVTDPQFGLVRANRPVNSGHGRIDGFEAQFTSFLDIESLPAWVRGFGVQANVTYLDAKTAFPLATAGTLSPILGVSKWTYNAAAMYERGPVSLRLSYNYRNHYLATLQQRGPDIYTETVQGIGRLDFSGSYTLFRNLTLFADWVNMLGKPFKSTLTYHYGTGENVSFPRATQYQETVYSAGIRFRF